MKQMIFRLAVASALFSLLPGAALADSHEAKKICKKFVKNEGYHNYHFKKIDVAQTRSGGYSVSGIIGKHGDRHEFTCRLGDDLLVQDVIINPLPGGGGNGGSNDRAPAEAVVACAEEAERYWNLRPGSVMPNTGKSTGGDMFEVQVRGGGNSGICTVTSKGDVKMIMNE